jgi:peptidoglycan/LPS O-acetylase OafA/YrhL
MTFVLVAYGMTMDVPLVSCYPEPRLKWIVADFLAHLGMLHGLHPILDRAGGNPPFWTLAREEYFYVMYFAVLAWRRALGLFVSLNLVVLLGLAFPVTMGFVLSTGSSWWSVVNSSAVVLWVQWCLGMVAVEAYYGIVRIPRCCSTFGFLPFWAGMAFTSEALVPALSPLTWGITFFTLVNACVARERTTRWPQGRVAGWLAGVGLYSYSLYLVHNPARYITKRLLGAYAETSDPGRYLLNAAIMALAGYVAGRLFFSLVERRFLPRNHGRVTSMVDDSDQGAVPVATKPAPTRAGLVRL